MRRLSKRQVLLLHEQLLSQTGGLPGLREELSGIILAVAAGEKTYEDLLRWLIEHQKG